MSFAEVSVEFQLVRPEMLQEAGIEIEEGRHVLYEMVTENYVSNNTSLKIRLNETAAANEVDKEESPSVVSVSPFQERERFELIFKRR